MLKNLQIINNISESGLFLPSDLDKSQEEWVEEFLDFGLINLPESRFFEVPRQANPLSIQLADDKFIPKVGENPRIYVSPSALKDEVFMSILDENNVSLGKHYGNFIKTYGFYDHRTTSELGSFLVSFEKAYLKRLDEM